MTTRILLGALLAAAASPTAAIAQVVNVSGGGDVLAIAVQLAAGGTTFVVGPGVYDGFPISDKDVTIVAPQRATVRGYVNSTSSTGDHYLRVAGLDFVEDTSGWPLYRGAVYADGDLFVEDCTMEFVRVSATTRAQVFIRDTVITSPLRTLALTNCDATIDDTEVSGGVIDTGAGYTVPGAAIELVGTTLRAERVNAYGVLATLGPGTAVSVYASSQSSNPIVTFVDCELHAAPPVQAWPPAVSVQVAQGGEVILHDTLTPDGVTGAHTFRPLASAAWTTRDWAPGGMSDLLFTDEPTTVGTIVLGWDHERVDLPFVAEPLFVGGTPNWVLWDFGVTDAQGELPRTITLPNVPALLYTELFATGVFLDPVSWRATASIGGLLY